MFLKSKLSLSTLLVGLGIAIPSFADVSSSSSITPYIINGNTVSTASYPYMALLIKNLSTETEYKIETFCGGTLLDEQHVLTAAHCLYTDKPSEFENLEVVFNVDRIENDAFNTNNMYAADLVYYPDDYSDIGSFDNDIAIIRLAVPVSQSTINYNDFVLRTAEERYQQDGETFTVLGYGKTGPDANSSNTLQVAQVEYAQPDLCNQSFESLTLTDKQICVSGEVIDNLQTGVCGGDSGGPLLYEEDGTQYQVGIVSFGPESCGSTDIPVQSVYTKVSSYEGWIASVLAGTEEPKYEVGQQNNGAQGDSESSSSGGSLGIFSIAMLFSLGLIRRHKRIQNN